MRNMDGNMESPHRIELPAHHPEVAAMEDGDELHIRASKAPPPSEPYAGTQGAPLTHSFNVHHIERVPKPKGKKGTAVDYAVKHG